MKLYQVTETNSTITPYIITEYNPEWKRKPPLHIGSYAECLDFVMTNN